MTDEEIEICKLKFNALNFINEDNKTKYDEMDFLEEDPNVQRYLEILESLDIEIERPKVETTETLIERAFYVIAYNTKNDNNIWIYLGGDSFHRYYYRNLETKEKHIVSAKHHKDIFDRNNHVIYPNCEDKEQFYNELRKQYFLDLLTISQEEAVQRVLKHKH